MRILLVDDEKNFVKALKEILEDNHYTVECVYDGQEALDYIHYESFDVILLDVMMPKMDGYTLIKKIRSEGNNIPVIFLSAKGEVDDKIKGLELGGDDYLPKPFSSKELLARLKVILRRKDGVKSNSLAYEGLSIDESDCSLVYKDKKETLSNKEYQLMELFLRKPEKIYSADSLLNEAWAIEDYADVSSLWVFLSNLRKKLKSLNCPIVIKSERGLGYKLTK